MRAPARWDVMVDESSAAFSEGREHGRFEENGAGDCPYLPGDAQAQRDDWMEGFSQARAEIVTFRADEDNERPPNTPHAG